MQYVLYLHNRKTCTFLFVQGQKSRTNTQKLDMHMIFSMHDFSRLMVRTYVIYSLQGALMKMMMFNQQQNTVRPVTFNFTEPTENVFTLRLLMATDQQKHVRYRKNF